MSKELAKSLFVQNKALKSLMLWSRRMFGPLLGLGWLRALIAYPGFILDWLRFLRAGGQASFKDLWPCLLDRTAKSPLDPHYFHQAIWAFRRILHSGAKKHVDIGSDVRFVGMLTTVLPVCFIDIRPLELDLPNYQGLNGSILDLPLEDGSIESLSSMHVIEHIGLGRYGDPIYPDGPKKAAQEIVRVLADQGKAYVSVPIGRPRVQFNGQRTFSVEQVLTLFTGLNLLEMSVVDAHGRFLEAAAPHDVDLGEDSALQDGGLGMFVFVKLPRGA